MRQACPTAWDLLLDECRAGLRRWAGIQRGDSYSRLLSHLGEGDAGPPKPHERPLGDYLMPTRPGQMLHLVNVVTSETGIDAMDWSVQRLLGMVATLGERNQQRQPDALDDL